MLRIRRKDAADPGEETEDESGGHAKNRKLVGQEAGFEVSEGQPDAEKRKQREFSGEEHIRKMTAAREKEERGREFDDGVSPGDGRTAVATASTEKYPTQDGDVVVPGDGASAVRARGAWRDYRTVTRKAGDADIEEAAERESEEECDYVEQRVHAITVQKTLRRDMESRLMSC